MQAPSTWVVGWKKGSCLALDVNQHQVHTFALLDAVMPQLQGGLQTLGYKSSLFLRDSYGLS